MKRLLRIFLIGLPALLLLAACEKDESGGNVGYVRLDPNQQNETPDPGNQNDNTDPDDPEDLGTGLPVVYVSTENGAGIWSKEE